MSIKKIKDLQKSYLFIYLITAVLTIVFLIQIILYVTGNYSIPFKFDTFYGDKLVNSADPNAKFGYIIIILSYLGFLFAAIGQTLAYKKEEKYIWFFTLGQIILLIFAIFSGIFYVGIILILLSIFSFMKGYREIKNANKNLSDLDKKEIAQKNDDKEAEQNTNAYKIKSNGKIIYMVFFILVYVVLGFLISIFFIKNSGSIAILDALASCFLLVTWYSFFKKWNIVFYPFLIINDLLFISLFIVLNSWLGFSLAFIYLLFDIVHVYDFYENGTEVDWLIVHN